MSDDPNGENQWVTMELTNRMRKNDLRVKNAHLDYGKFYRGSKESEIQPSEVDQIITPPGAMGTVNACGRNSSPTGTEGHIDLYDDDTKICKLYWNCPYWSKTNTFELKDYDAGSSDYNVNVSDYNHGPGPIGRVTIVISKMA